MVTSSVGDLGLGYNVAWDRCGCLWGNLWVYVGIRHMGRMSVDIDALEPLCSVKALSFSSFCSTHESLLVSGGLERGIAVRSCGGIAMGARGIV